MTTAEIKSEVIKNLETIRQLRRGFRVADLAFWGGTESAVITVALRQLVNEGVLTATRSGKVLRYAAKGQ